MKGFCSELACLLESEAFQCFLNSDKIKLAQVNALTSLLIKNNIDFDSIFTSKTRRNPATLTITVVVNECTRISRKFTFSSCD
ncbi:MAG: hypothetical protein N4A48_13505 [Tepidibacter sp.]|jgi:hypothetical protein|uniref:hypothetical protein n=1 Tax=Tepidibacter sp. TaxID=2529387 RepID=UPI0025ED208A|nr:hypothetical protein [Tepidibacter sp.]MCT4509745.1 hypothetical protein [Tepidibacter sp.]